ncbi:MAG: hypothetical protein V4858_19045 [Pseudomonadota bacterium]
MTKKTKDLCARALLLALLAPLLLATAPAHANVVKNAAGCLAAPFKAAAVAVSSGEKVLQLAVDDPQCIARVMAVDPTTIVSAIMVVGLQQKNIIPKDLGQCRGFITGQASGLIADALLEVPGLPSLLGSKGTDMLEDIVAGATSSALSSVPGMGTITGSLSCGCAVADVGGPDVIKKVMNAVGSGAQQCGGLVTDLIKGGLAGIETGAIAVENALESIYQGQHMPQETYYRLYFANRKEAEYKYSVALMSPPAQLHNSLTRQSGYIDGVTTACHGYFNSHRMSPENAEKTCNSFRNSYNQEFAKWAVMQDQVRLVKGLAADPTPAATKLLKSQLGWLLPRNGDTLDLPSWKRGDPLVRACAKAVTQAGKSVPPEKYMGGTTDATAKRYKTLALLGAAHYSCVSTVLRDVYGFGQTITEPKSLGQFDDFYSYTPAALAEPQKYIQKIQAMAANAKPTDSVGSIFYTTNRPLAKQAHALIAQKTASFMDYGVTKVSLGNIAAENQHKKEEDGAKKAGAEAQAKLSAQMLAKMTQLKAACSDIRCGTDITRMVQACGITSGPPDESGDASGPMSIEKGCAQAYNVLHRISAAKVKLDEHLDAETKRVSALPSRDPAASAKDAQKQQGEATQQFQQLRDEAIEKLITIGSSYKSVVAYEKVLEPQFAALMTVRFKQSAVATGGLETLRPVAGAMGGVAAVAPAVIQPPSIPAIRPPPILVPPPTGQLGLRPGGAGSSQLGGSAGSGNLGGSSGGNTGLTPPAPAGCTARPNSPGSFACRDAIAQQRCEQASHGQATCTLQPRR